MHAANTLLKRQFPDIEGLESTLLAQSACGFSVRSMPQVPHVQIHNIDDIHWVVSACFPGSDVVYVVDTLRSELSSSLEQQLCKIHHTSKASLQVETAKVQLQRKHRNNCGLFAIAFATEFYYSREFKLCVFDESKLRQHLLSCYENGKLTPFPKEHDGAEVVCNKESIELYCKCRMPEHFDSHMVQCMSSVFWVVPFQVCRG